MRPPRPAQEAVDAGQQLRVRLGQHALEVGNLADFPQQAHGVRVPGERHHLGVAHERRERALVLGVAHADEEGVGWLAVEAAEQRERREEVELVRAPEELRERREAVRLDGLDQSPVERPELRRGRELPVAHVAAGAARDLAHLRRRQRRAARRRRTSRAPVKTTVSMSRFSPMPIASVATRWSTSPAWYRPTCALRVRGESAPNTSAAPPRSRRSRAATSYSSRSEKTMTAERGGSFDRLLGSPYESVDSRWRVSNAARGDQLVQDRPDRLGPDQPGLERAARVQDPVGEDVAALPVGRELDFVDRQEVDLEVERHRLDGRDPVRRPPRDDPFFAGDERDGLGSLERRHAVVVLARQQPEREADHPGGVRSIRSMARCVLPVFVGPRRAVTGRCIAVLPE